jgi:hypothetical protein
MTILAGGSPLTLACLSPRTVEGTETETGKSGGELNSEPGNLSRIVDRPLWPRCRRGESETLRFPTTTPTRSPIADTPPRRHADTFLPSPTRFPSSTDHWQLTLRTAFQLLKHRLVNRQQIGLQRSLHAPARRSVNLARRTQGRCLPRPYSARTNSNRFSVGSVCDERLRYHCRSRF